MGKARAKKKTTVVLSSDDEESGQLTLNKAAVSTSTSPQRPIAATHKASPAKVNTPKSRKSRKDVLVSPGSQKSAASPSPSQKSRPKERTLFSFFSAQTQRQQASSSINGHTMGSESKAGQMEEEEDIEDDSLDEAMASLDETKFGSDYPLPVRQKRKINELDESTSIPIGSRMFKRAATADQAVRSTVAVDLRPWTERFGPTEVDELAVHKKKVQDVKIWLQRVIAGQERKRLLILKGGAGTGKTVTLKLLSQELGIHVSEWSTSNTSSEEGFVSMSAQFQDFVARTGTFGTLDFASNTTQSPSVQQSNEQVSNRKQLVLIEEFPNTFSRFSSGLQSFRTAVLQYLEASMPSASSFFTSQASTTKPIVPIVMIISESLLSTSTAAADSFTAYRLLGPDILGHQATTVIEFNPIAPTFMTKALDLVLQKESKKSGRKRAPGPAVLKHLAGIGDIRSAISSLEFLCLRGDESSEWSGRVTFTKQKRGGVDAPMSKMEAQSLEMVTQRESTLGIFHAVGKVVYNKRETPPATDTPPPQPPNHLPQHARPKVSEVNTETLLNELGTDIATFIAALHENYILSCSGLDSEETLDHVNGCIDSLSDADILSPDRFSPNVHRRAQTYAGTGTDSLRQDEISFQTSVRGLLFNLPHPVKRILPPQANTHSKSFGSRSAAFQMFYPTSMRIWRRQEEIEQALGTVVAKLRSRGFSKLSKISSSASSSNSYSPSAVETWRLNRFGGNSASAYKEEKKQGRDVKQDDEMYAATAMVRGLMAKDELLLERLPYMSTMRKYNKLRDTQDINRDMDKVTRMGMFATVDGDDDDADSATADIEEQWSTDKPSEEIGPVRRKMFIIQKPVSKSDAVKDKMESLVLEDDDIEDD
ncbi:uncharacterized protein PV09_01450 [Verruconis gallopava]|uniref:Checkpoint protein RAD24-like helical bundle domain-containing protein n=1 Tax=Verruconis gallopava TaxID=253628 RepID=A0A0D2AL43_9PEZI|nr:uncharacterized protein PV09_01450 [Verruconis gallopava]KIW07483.1 hypothetical protein PV09_01450 [Verruconis gallopava]